MDLTSLDTGKHLSAKKSVAVEYSVRIASTSWFAERLLIPEVTALSRQSEGSEIQFSVPDHGFERALLEAFTVSDLLPLPFIQHRGLNPNALLSVTPRSLFCASMDNLPGVRSALVAGHGWSLVPSVLVQKEINDEVLIEVEFDSQMDRHVCLWWLRSSSRAKKKVAAVESWLRKSVAKVLD